MSGWLIFAIVVSVANLWNIAITVGDIKRNNEQILYELKDINRKLNN